MRCAVYVKDAAAPFSAAYQMKSIQSLLEPGGEIVCKYEEKQDSTEAFQKAVADGIDRRFDCILMHCVFLFGENLWQAEEILDKTFFAAGIHFVVAEDSFFSRGKTLAEVDAYFEKKRQESGTQAHLQVVNHSKLAPRDCRYGFRLTEDHMGFVVNEETAAVVKEIFRLFLGGMKLAEIARMMQKRGVINPMDYKKKEIHHTVPPVPTAWVPDSVKNILMTELYTGTGTKNTRGQAVLIHADPLISISDFVKAQKKLGTVKPKTVGYENNAFFRRVWFEDKQVLTRELDGELYFLAGQQQISYSNMSAAVRQAIRLEIADVKAALERLSAGCEKEMAEALAPLRKKAWELFHAMEEDATDDLNSAFSELIRQEILLEKTYSVQNEWIQKYRDMKLPDQLNFPFIQQWVKRIMIDVDGGIHVLFHKSEWKDRLFWFRRSKIWHAKADGKQL